MIADQWFEGLTPWPCFQVLRGKTALAACGMEVLES